MFTKLRAGFIASIFGLLAACGGGGNGGGGSNTPPPSSNNPPPSPTAEDIASANASQLKMELRADTRELIITWTDTFAAEGTYIIEARASDGTWQRLDTLAPSAGTGNSYEWRQVVGASRTYRVSATKAGYAVALATPQGQTEIAVELPAGMSLEIDQIEPVQGTVQLSVANLAADVSAVRYRVDSHYFQVRNTSEDFTPNYRALWNTSGDGDHVVEASVQTSDRVITLRRTIRVDNPGLRISLRVLKYNYTGMPRRLWLYADATSEVAVRQVEFFANGTSVNIATKAAPNSLNVYKYEELVAVDLPVGRNVFKAIATDANGNTATSEVELINDNVPTLTLTSPADGEIVRDTLHIEGTFSEDYSTATLTASLGNTQILSTAAPGTFSADYSLAGLPPGEYQFAITARDQAGQETTLSHPVIIPPNDLSYELVATDAMWLLATEHGAMLYRKMDRSYVVRNAAGVETTLQVPDRLTYVDQWRFNGGRVVMAAVDANVQQIYAFAPNGEMTNISATSGPAHNDRPVLKAPWVVWKHLGTPRQFRLYNLDTGTSVTVAIPATATGRDLNNYALVETPSGMQLLFTATTGGTPTSPVADVFRYNVQTQTTDTLTAGDAYYHSLQSDGSRVALLKGNTWNQYELLTAPLSNPATMTTLDSHVHWPLYMRDDMVAWYSGQPTILRAHDGTATRELGEDAGLHSVGDGRVLFSDNGRLMLSRSDGGTQVLLHFLPDVGSRMHDDDSAFVTTSADLPTLIYRLQLP